MQRLEVSGAVRLIYRLLGVKRLIASLFRRWKLEAVSYFREHFSCVLYLVLPRECGLFTAYVICYNMFGISVEK